MALTQYALEQAMNFLLNAEAVTRPTSWYLAWHIGPPGDDGAANEQTTGGDANYARQPITYGSSSWVSASKTRVSLNTNTINITPAAGTSYTIYGFSIWDSLTGGNCLLSAESLSALAVSDTSPLGFVAGDFPVELARSAGAGWTSYGAGLFLDWLLTTDTITRPADWWAALHLDDPGDDGSANEVLAGDDPDYARQAIDFAAAVSIANSITYTRNNLAAIWVPGTGANFTATYLTVNDAVTAGNAIYSMPFTPTRTGVDGQTLAVAINQAEVIGAY